MTSANNMSDNVVLVDKYDNEVGLMPKLEAHQKGLLHRAFSVFIFNNKGELLLQQRAIGKYHSGGLWSNTCCSHPLPGESIGNAAVRRLNEEMGIVCEMKPFFSFIYKANLDNNLIEHEFDHVVFGNFDGAPEINLDEVQNWKYIDMDELMVDIKRNPNNYTEWLKICLDELCRYLDFSKIRKVD